MGNKGSTKNERKINVKRSETEKAREKKIRTQISELTALPFFRRDPNYSTTLEKLRGMLRKSITKQRLSPNDTQTGKRGRK